MASSDSPCTLTLADGTHYDLSSLSSASQDYTAKVGEREFKLNVCRAVVSELWKVDEPDKVGGSVGRQDGDFSIGRYNDTLLLSESTQQPMMYMAQGSACPLNPNEQASTAVRFICNQAEFGVGKPQLIAALPPGPPENHCQFFFEWHTHVACPTNPKAELERAHYIAFFAILAVAILTWFLGHTLYNRLYLKRRGSEQFPFPTFLSALNPSALRSRIKLPTFSRPEVPRPGGWRRSRQQGGYSHIRQAEEADEGEGFAGRFSLDDDDDDQDEPRGLNEQAVRDSVLGGEREAWGDLVSAPNGPNSGDTSKSNGKGKGKARELLDL